MSGSFLGPGAADEKRSASSRPEWELVRFADGESVNLRELPVDGLGQGKGIEPLPERLEGLEAGTLDALGRDHAIEGRQRRIVEPAHARADADPAEQLH